IKILLDIFLKTEVGLAIRATGDNQRMSHSFSANTELLIILGIGISNGLVALSGALIAQHGGFSDVSMGIGMIIIGLASVIIGEALFGSKTIVRATLAVILGAIIYRIVVTLALRASFLETGDMKLITAILVILALIAQHGGFSDVSMGIGMIIIGLASVIIGEALFGSKTIVRATLAVILGAIIYRIVVTLALRASFLETGDMKLITAILVILAL